ncbi:hypothetical protein BGZ61DRAFT_533733 [Ilyonectria robusta]|uniref:uncharacterized protein n=1 Tax=Ilyonectria robusta TaxID=1079257 RepID=UPI001E8EB278|nr:uncharacterized protein BGZ61DRAFT_533733 [Ilyonectria robusta]KAH8686166.1 hypothetical protein BGZ61DRAFT_533733 [Ilyonectria robusta]
MQITGKSELMKNQKHAEVLSPTKTFDVLQTPEGDSLFFSIGTDNIFYVTREVNQTQTGWTRVDLSSPISTLQGGAAIVVKTFALAQNPKTQMFDVAVVITISGNDLLYMSTNHSNTAADWASGITWTEIPFDAAGVSIPNPLVVSDVYLMTIANPDDESQPGTLTCFVDVIHSPTNDLDRYYVLSSGLTKWVRHPWAINLGAGLIDSCLGRRTGDEIPGIYTFGSLEGTKELIFVPEYNFWDQNLQPPLARLQLPQQPGTIASALNSSGYSNLFVAAASGLYVFAPNAQYDGASGTLVVPDATIGGVDLFANITSLAAYTAGNKTVVWALGQQGQLFHVDCTAGEETTPSAWSTPVPFSANINQFAFFLNAASTNIVLFAYSSGQDILQFTQQPSGEWVQRHILMPPSESSKYVEFTSFTTRIALQDDYGSPIPFQNMNITSEVPVSVYINDTYHVLGPTVPVTVQTDCGGSVTVIQETNTLGAVKLTATVDGPSPVSSTVDPLIKASAKLQSIQSGDDLANITIPTDDGSQKPLISSNVSSDTRNAAAQALTQLMQAKSGIDAKSLSNTTVNGTGGSVDPPSSTTASANPQSNPPTVDANMPTAPSLTGSSTSTVDLLEHSVEIAAEDFFQFLKLATQTVSEFVVHFANEAWHFVATIGTDVYHAVLDTVVAVVNAVEFVFQKLEVAFEDLFRWLGFIFSWQDIKRSHSVMKYTLKAQIQNFINSIDVMATNIDTFFVDAENIVNGWAGVTDPGESIGTQQKQTNQVQGSDSPQAHWALYHTQNGTDSAQVTSSEQPGGDLSSVEKILADLDALVTDQIDDIKTVAIQIKTEIADHIHDLTPIEIIQKILAIAADLLLKTAKDVLVTVLDVFKLIVQEAFNMFDSPLNIPVLSQVYKLITGDELTIIDLVCLVSAIPATIIYKIICGKAPFPDDATVQSYTGSGTIQPISIPSLSSIPQQATTSAASFIQIPQQYAMREAVNGVPPKTMILSADETSPSAAEPAAAPTSDQSQESSSLETLQVFFNYSTVGSGSLLAMLSLPKRRFLRANFQQRANPQPAQNAQPQAGGNPLQQPLLGQAGGGNGGNPGPAAMIQPPPPLGAWVEYGYAGVYLAYMFPNFLYSLPLQWYQGLNVTIAAIDAVKALADATGKMDHCIPRWTEVVSPVVEFVINTIWLVPAIASYQDTPQPTAKDDYGLAANVFFDFGGIITPATTPYICENPPLNLAAFLATLGSIAGYASFSSATAYAMTHQK